MSILADSKTRLVVQGMTGSEGKFHASQMIDYGTAVVAGVTPGRGGETCLDRPVFNTVAQACAETGANASIVFVPAPFAADAALEAIDAGVELVVIITENIPTRHMLGVYWEAKRKGVRVIGPNCPGLITPGQAKLGIMPGHICMPGKIGVISRSGTLTYEMVNELTLGHYGQTTCLGIGGDPVIGTSFADALAMFEADPATEAVAMIGEIGGTDEETAADYISRKMSKPVVSFIAGQTAPPGKRMGHAGAIIAGGKGTAIEKIAALKTVGVHVLDRIDQVCATLKAAGIEPLDG